MTLDPITLWFYRGVLGAVGLACVALAVYAFSRAGSTAGVQGLSGLFTLASDYKSYILSAAGSISTGLWTMDLISDKAFMALAGVFGFTAVATLRAGTAKAQQAAETATSAVKVAGVKMERAVNEVAATKVEAAPALPTIPPVPPSPAPVVPNSTRVPRERDLPGGT